MILAASAALLLAPSGATQVPHDGAHDFDFDLGSWKTHIEHILKDGDMAAIHVLPIDPETA